MGQDLVTTVGRNVWRLAGHGTIDDRPPVRCTLIVRDDGNWVAELATFTFADTADLLFTSDEGGQFCGPVQVGRSRVDTYPANMRTELTGRGPLLVVSAGAAGLELPAEEEILEAEVVP